jgi:hypothetical protein
MMMGVGMAFGTDADEGKQILSTLSMVRTTKKGMSFDE